MLSRSTGSSTCPAALRADPARDPVLCAQAAVRRVLERLSLVTSRGSGHGFTSRYCLPDVYQRCPALSGCSDFASGDKMMDGIEPHWQSRPLILCGTLVRLGTTTRAFGEPAAVHLCEPGQSCWQGLILRPLLPGLAVAKLPHPALAGSGSSSARACVPLRARGACRRGGLALSRSSRGRALPLRCRLVSLGRPRGGRTA